MTLTFKVMLTIASHSPSLNLNIPETVREAWFQRTIIRKWSRDRWRHVTPKDQTRYPNTLRAQYLENSWRCYLATIAKVCCDAVRSSIIATAWLLVGVFHGLQCVCGNYISHSCRHSVHIWWQILAFCFIKLLSKSLHISRQHIWRVRAGFSRENKDAMSTRPSPSSFEPLRI